VFKIKSIWAIGFSVLLTSLIVGMVGCTPTEIKENYVVRVITRRKPKKIAPSAQEIAWKSVLAATEEGTILNGQNYPSKPWLILESSIGNKKKYQVLDQENQPVDVGYLMVNQRSSPIVVDGIIYFIYDQKIGFWDTKNKIFKLQENPTKFTEMIVDKGKYYLESERNERFDCKVEEIDVQTGEIKEIINSNTNLDYNCDLKDHLRYVEGDTVWSVWSHSTNSYLSVYYQQYSLKTGNLLKKVTLEENYYDGDSKSRVVNITVNLKKKEPNYNTKQLYLYECSLDYTQCPPKESEEAAKLSLAARKEIEKNVPFLVNKNIFADRYEKLQCGNFIYHRVRNPGKVAQEEITFNGEPIFGYEKAIVANIQCVQ